MFVFYVVIIIYLLLLLAEPYRSPRENDILSSPFVHHAALIPRKEAPGNRSVAGPLGSIPKKEKEKEKERDREREREREKKDDNRKSRSSKREKDKSKGPRGAKGDEGPEGESASSSDESPLPPPPKIETKEEVSDEDPPPPPSEPIFKPPPPTVSREKESKEKHKHKGEHRESRKSKKKEKEKEKEKEKDRKGESKRRHKDRESRRSRMDDKDKDKDKDKDRDPSRLRETLGRMKIDEERKKDKDKDKRDYPRWGLENCPSLNADSFKDHFVLEDELALDALLHLKVDHLFAALKKQVSPSSAADLVDLTHDMALYAELSFQEMDQVKAEFREFNKTAEWDDVMQCRLCPPLDQDAIMERDFHQHSRKFAAKAEQANIALYGEEHAPPIEVPETPFD